MWKPDWVTSAVDGDPTAGAVVFWRAQYVPTVLFPGRFQCPCDCVSLLSQKIHLRTGNLSVVGGTSVPQRTGAPSVGLCCNQHVQLLRPDCVSDRRCSNLIWALRPLKVAGLSLVSDSYLVDPASSHMLVSETKPCTSKYKLNDGETANGSLQRLWCTREFRWIFPVTLELIHAPAFISFAQSVAESW